MSLNVRVWGLLGFLVSKIITWEKKAPQPLVATSGQVLEGKFAYLINISIHVIHYILMFVSS